MVGSSKKSIHSKLSKLDKELLSWCRDLRENYSEVNISNLDSSFHSGLVFCCILNNFYPDQIDYISLVSLLPCTCEEDAVFFKETCLRSAFQVASDQLAIPPPLFTNRDEEVSVEDLDENLLRSFSPPKTVITSYLKLLYAALGTGTSSSYNTLNDNTPFSSLNPIPKEELSKENENVEKLSLFQDPTPEEEEEEKEKEKEKEGETPSLPKGGTAVDLNVRDLLNDLIGLEEGICFQFRLGYEKRGFTLKVECEVALNFPTPKLLSFPLAVTLSEAAVEVTFNLVYRDGKGFAFVEDGPTLDSNLLCEFGDPLQKNGVMSDTHKIQQFVFSQIQAHLKRKLIYPNYLKVDLL